MPFSPAASDYSVASMILDPDGTALDTGVYSCTSTVTPAGSGEVGWDIAVSITNISATGAQYPRFRLSLGHSGTTLVACEQLGRRCYAIEIEPRYVDVAVRRWQKLTGKAATLAGDGRTFDAVSEERLPDATPINAA